MVRSENKRLVWTPDGSQERTQSRDRQGWRMGCLLHPWPTCPPHLLPLPLQRCEEVEAMRGQVSQEQELRAVVESCLLEQDGTRKDILAQLQETWALARDAALILDQLQ